MRLVTDHSLSAGAVSVQCLKCCAMVRLAEAIIDLDGPAFQAYYHPACAPNGPVATCMTDGCNRRHRR